MNYVKVGPYFKFHLELLKVDLISELRRRYSEDGEKWRRVLEVGLTWPYVPKHQRAALDTPSYAHGDVEECRRFTREYTCLSRSTKRLRSCVKTRFAL